MRKKFTRKDIDVIEAKYNKNMSKYRRTPVVIYNVSKIPYFGTIRYIIKRMNVTTFKKVCKNTSRRKPTLKKEYINFVNRYNVDPPSMGIFKYITLYNNLTNNFSHIKEDYLIGG